MNEKPIHLLLVEDDPDDAFLLRDMLDEAAAGQFTLVHAKRLDEALPLARTEPLDVALLDLSLPDSLGLETFQRLHQEAPELAVVVLTGLDDESLAVTAVREGAQDYLVKGQVSGSLLVRSIRYAIERQRTSYYRALLTEREKFDAAVSQMSDGIVVTDGDWRIASANRTACALLNLPVDDWQNLPLDEALFAFETSPTIEELYASNERMTAFDISRTTTRPPLLLDGRLSRLFDAAGKLLSTVLVVRDVTDERLARSVQANFMTAVPHKLRTPLSLLLGYLAVAKRLRPEELPDRWPHIVGIWETELRELIDMVQKLLDFENVATPQLEADLQPTDVAALIAEVVGYVRRHYPDREVETSVTVEPAAAYANYRRDHLRFILHELIDNAVKFADKQPALVEIRASATDPAWLRFTVSDNGPGIPHEYYTRVFEDFIQVEEYVTGSVPGWGVGLRMVRQMTDAYGGSATVTSQLGEGSTFTFALPAAPR
ncbi:MAG: ATP-binding protein [Armatimonadota bacterium]